MKTTESILRNAEDTLHTAKIGLEMYLGPKPEQRIAGLRNFIVFGRSVTFVLQNLRGTVGDKFDEWYTPKVNKMANDEIITYFSKLRSVLLKEGDLNIVSSAVISGNPFKLLRNFTPPPNTKGWFIGHTNGGSGWTVDVDGKEEKFYIDISKHTSDLDIKQQFHLIDAPDKLQRFDIKDLAYHYFNYLKIIVQEANNQFYVPNLR